VRLYPDDPARRTVTAVRDALTLVLLGLLARVGLEVHDAVDRLAVLGTGVREAGERVPFVGGSVEDLGRSGEDRVHRLANLLGGLVFALPAAFVLAYWLPSRVRQVRALTAAATVLRDPSSPEHQRLIAMRAAFSLPYGQLLRYTNDPLGDLAAERYDALVEAALDDVGLRVSAG
jgi:hypothetical protein